MKGMSSSSVGTRRPLVLQADLTAFGAGSRISLFRTIGNCCRPADGTWPRSARLRWRQRTAGVGAFTDLRGCPDGAIAALTPWGEFQFEHLSEGIFGETGGRNAPIAGRPLSTAN
jgi:hypothetical protein